MTTVSAVQIQREWDTLPSHVAAAPGQVARDCLAYAQMRRELAPVAHSLWPPELTPEDLVQAASIRVHTSPEDTTLFEHRLGRKPGKTGKFRGMAVDALQLMLDGEWHEQRQLARVIGQEVCALGGGLRRMCNQGLIETDWGQSSSRLQGRLYRLSDAGRVFLAQLDEEQSAST